MSEQGKGSEQRNSWDLGLTEEGKKKKKGNQNWGGGQSRRGPCSRLRKPCQVRTDAAHQFLESTASPAQAFASPVRAYQ